MPPAGTDELLDLALDAAAAAAAVLLERLPTARAGATTKTSATDMVTATDREVEALLRDRLLGRRPADGFLGEEMGETPGTSGIRWVVDPIDGTTNFLYGHPGCNVSVAAEDGEGSVVGVVVDPLLRDTFAAARGGGAHRNGTAIRCRPADDLADALCATGFSYDPDRRGRQGEVLARVLPHIRDVRRLGAAALDLCSVGCGRVDAYWEKGLGPWDLAAGGLIAREAGARVELEGTLGFVLAAPPGLFAALRDLLVDSGAPRA
ncbi:MAG: inositol monophosphatase [Actinomycetota bacterium]|nr:inositol monophosphatase [Acidimicrobiia bacterium]MDQ3293876.1 inositol monophosphatase [Actinomycetota bacterium]